MTLTAEPFSSLAPEPALQLVCRATPVRVLHVVPSLHGGGMERALLRLLAGFSDCRAEAGQQGVTHGVCVLQHGDADLIDQCAGTATTWVLGSETSRLSRRYT